MRQSEETCGHRLVETQYEYAASQQAVDVSETRKATPAGNNAPRGEGQAIKNTQPKGRSPDPQSSVIDDGDVGHSLIENHSFSAHVKKSAPAVGGQLGRDNHVKTAPQKSPHGEQGELVHSAVDTQRTGDQFSHPLIAEITETWRMRQDMVRAQQKLTLQSKAICRRFCAGDKGEAEKLYKAVVKGSEHPMAEHASIALMALLMASKPVEDQRKAYEKHLGKLAKELPIAHMVERVKGISYTGLASIVGEVGDMSAYHKGVAGIWKRAGLAVINGERQRKKGGDEALIHGYSPSRHAVFWNVGCALIKAQGAGEDAGPYRRIYDERKAYERARVETDGHAHNRAMRFMTKRLIKDLWQEWCAVANHREAA